MVASNFFLLKKWKIKVSLDCYKYYWNVSASAICARTLDNAPLIIFKFVCHILSTYLCISITHACHSSTYI